MLRVPHNGPGVLAGQAGARPGFEPATVDPAPPTANVQCRRSAIGSLRQDISEITYDKILGEL